MTDKEMLRLAAKAEGTISELDAWRGEDSSLETSHGLIWNPLTCAGQRYELAKKLGFRIYFGPNYLTYVAGPTACGVVRWPEDAADDAHAIVLAAARISASL